MTFFGIPTQKSVVAPSLVAFLAAKMVNNFRENKWFMQLKRAPTEHSVSNTVLITPYQKTGKKCVILRVLISSIKSTLCT